MLNDDKLDREGLNKIVQQYLDIFEDPTNKHLGFANSAYKCSKVFLNSYIRFIGVKLL